MADAFIYDAVRTPRGKGKKDGSLHATKSIKLLATALRALRDRNNLDTSLIDDVIMGCVTQTWEQSGDIAKAAAIEAGYDNRVSGVTLTRYCGSGLEAVNQAAAYIMSGQIDLLVAGGVESMSRVPLGSDASATLYDPNMIADHYIIPQGISADLIATINNINRNDLDSFSVESHNRAARARENGFFNKSLIPVRDMNGFSILEKDETIRAGSTVEKLAGLRPAFEKMGIMGGFNDIAIQRYPEVEKINHVHHAGNSSGIVDGASAVLVGSKEIGEKLGLKPRARVRSFAVMGGEPTIMLTAPAPATRKALSRAGMEVGDIDLFEINEAFAVVPIRYMQELGIDHSKVNVNGGAIAMGHPLGATGAMLIGTLIDELERQDKQTGVVSLCIGGGMGIATVVERV